jgi:hypothetical protein
MFKSQNVKWIFLAIVVVFLLWGLNSYSKGKSYEGYEARISEYSTPYDKAYRSTSSTRSSSNSSRGSAQRVRKATPKRRASPKKTRKEGFEGMQPTEEFEEGFENYRSQNVADPKDLLPVDKKSGWGQLNPVQNKNPKIPDLLQAGNLMGIDTIGQTLKNANLQLRSDPYIPKGSVGPWNNSTYEPDLARVPLELGKCSS